MSGFTKLSHLASATETDETSVVVLISCHNRRETTLRGLESLAMTIGPRTEVGVLLYDDGSSDGTVEAVGRLHPEVEVVRGRGGHYWSASMAAAQDRALALAAPDHLLWFNDDVELLPNALETLLTTARRLGDEAVVVGCLVDRRSGATTYSGYRRTGRRPLSLAALAPTATAQQVATFNGNVVLVPRRVYQAVGVVDREYQHAYGDIDYGYRVRSAGFASWMAPGVLGFCARNPVAGSWLDPELLVRKRVGLLLGRKGMPLRSHHRFFRRHGGPFWGLLLVGSYVVNFGRIFSSSLESTLRRASVRSRVRLRLPSAGSQSPRYRSEDPSSGAGAAVRSER